MNQSIVDWAQGGYKDSPYYVQGSTGAWGIDVDKQWGFQCYDFVAGLTAFLGLGIFYVQDLGALHFWDIAPDSFERVQDPQPGDIYIYGRPFGWNGERYLGDTGIVTSVVSRDDWTAVSQNWVKASLEVGSPPATVKHNANGLIGFLRYKGDNVDNIEILQSAINAHLKTIEVLESALNKSKADGETWLSALNAEREKTKQLTDQLAKEGTVLAPGKYVVN